MPPSHDRSVEELLDLLARTLLGTELREPEQFRQQVYRELAEDNDPLLQEIGEQLRDGVMRPHQMLQIPAYRAVMEQRLELLREQPVDPAAIRRELAELVDAANRHRETDR